MLPDSDITRLRHMLESSEEAIEYARGRSRGDLDLDRPFEHLLVRCVEIVGEAASRISEETQSAHPEIPWRMLVGMRNRLVHAYFDIEKDTLWRTVETELPVLANQVGEILKAAKQK